MKFRNPHNISRASRQNGVAAFSSTHEIAVDKKKITKWLHTARQAKSNYLVHYLHPVLNPNVHCKAKSVSTHRRLRDQTNKQKPEGALMKYGYKNTKDKIKMGEQQKQSEVNKSVKPNKQGGHEETCMKHKSKTDEPTQIEGKHSFIKTGGD